MEAQEIKKRIECVTHLRLETIRLMNNPETYLQMQQQIVDNCRATLTREENRLADMEFRVLHGGDTIDECDARLITLRNELILESRKALVERVQQLVELRREMEREESEISEDSIIS